MPEEKILNENINEENKGLENPFSKESYERDDYSKLRKDQSAIARGFQDYRSGVEKRHYNIQKNFDPTNAKYSSTEENVRDTSLDNYAERVQRNQINYENQLAKNQSLPEKFMRANANFATTVGTTVLGSTVGLLYGGAAAIGEGDIDKLWDNDFQRALDDISSGIRKENAIYREFGGDTGFNQVENFLFDDLVQGAGFMVGAIASEYLTAGLGSFALGANAGSRALKSMKYVDDILKTGKGLNKIDDVARQSILKRAKDLERAARKAQIR